MERPKVKISHKGTSTFGVIKECITSARDAGWPDQDIEKFVDHALAGDFEHLLRAVRTRFHVIE